MLAILLAALAGGVVLNVMPCVLPVLALKAFSVVDHAKHDASKRRMHGFAYTAGTMSLFLALGTLVVIAKSAGKHLGWGMQFQHPPFVAAMIAIIFAFSLNALGVFEILVSAQGEGNNDKLWGSFVNGLFAAILSTPCSAPFVGSAAAFAFASTTGAVQTLLVFAMMGFGLALPYLVLTLVPAFAKILPKPGAWMETVKQVMGFLLLGTAIWLFRSFQVQVTPQSANGFLFFLLALAVALWAGHRFGGIDRTALRRWVVRVSLAGMVFGAYKLAVKFEPAAQAQPDAPVVAAGDVAPVVKDGHIVWTPYSKARVDAELAHGRPVIMDFTAEWCANCKTLNETVVETGPVRSALERTKVFPVVVDMTSDNDELNELLASVIKVDKERDGIPVYVIFYPDGTRDLLPLVFTADYVVEHLENASKKYPPEKFAMN